MNVTRALAHARTVFDDVERKCATDILEVSKIWLACQPVGHVGLLTAMSVTIPNGLNLNVSPIWLRHLKPIRLMVLHFWQKPLSGWQLGAAGAVIRSAVTQNHPQFADCEIDFISVPLPDFASRRRFEHYEWAGLKPLSDKDLSRFWKQFCAAWAEYQARGPREIRRRRLPDLFSRR